MSTPRIYLSPPHQSGREAHYLAEVLESNWIGPCGPHLAEFERQIAERAGVHEAVGLASGTAAMHLLVRHLRVQPGGGVLCQSLTFCATANPIVYEGGRPVFHRLRTKLVEHRSSTRGG